ncbi:tetratricopeptide repeat protein [Streptomyces sp. NPDC088254]|uniref:tetratricopeptide repeat protein n=1 Tax=Streptomyces sp. NPDC088254 TaxID=3365847 RepID=UPI0038056E6D
MEELSSICRRRDYDWRYLSKSWRPPAVVIALAAVGSIFIPAGEVWRWGYLLGVLLVLNVLARRAHRDVPLGLAMAQWIWGTDHPRVVRLRVAWAAQLSRQGRIGLAVTQLDDILPGMIEVWGPDHPETLTVRAMHLRLRGDYGALPGRVAALEELTGEMLRAMGPGHPETLAARGLMAKWLDQDGDTNRALALYEDVVSVSSETLGAGDTLTLRARRALIELRYITASDANNMDGRYAALDEMTDAVRDMLWVLGPAHPITVGSQRTLDLWMEETRVDIALGKIRPFDARRRGEADPGSV